MTNRPQMSADDIEQAGRMLLPVFLDASRRANEEMFHDRLEPALEPIRGELEKQGDRLTALESLKGKAMVGWGILVFGVTLSGTWLKGWLVAKIWPK